MAGNADRGPSILGAEMRAGVMQKGAAATLPLDLILDAIPSLPRPLLVRMVQRMIDRIDEMDGDTDVEPNGDEGDYTGSEDDCCPIWANGTDMGAGCPFADAGEASNRTTLSPTLDGEDQSFVIVPAPIGIKPTRYQVS